MKHPKGITSMAVVGIVLGVLILAGAVYYAVSLSSENSNANTSNTNVTTNEAMKDDTMIENTNADAMMDDEDSMMEEKNTNEATEDDTMMEDTDTEAKAPGEYTEYSSTAFAEASGKQRVLFFYAAWCPTCRPADANISANESQIPDDVVVFRTDYDTESELKAKYGITYQHTFVLVDENGNALKKWNGGQIDEIIENVT